MARPFRSALRLRWCFLREQRGLAGLAREPFLLLLALQLFVVKTAGAPLGGTPLGFAHRV
jgi:hypothetical protein